MRHNRPVISALLLVGLLGSQSIVAAQQISEQALNQKLELAKKLVTKILHQTQANKIDAGQWQAPYRLSIEKINLIQQAMYQGENQQADQLLTDVFALVIEAKSKLSKEFPDRELLTGYFKQRNKALNSFKSSLEETLKREKQPQAQQALDQATKLQQQANSLLTQDIRQAITKLEQAYELVIRQITRLRDNETTVVSLNFATPEDEYLYDLKRVTSFNMLLEMQLKQTTPNATTLTKIKTYQNKAEDYQSLANQFAVKGNYNQALIEIARTIQNQQRALRTAGLNIM
jgi:hypothetical protein